LNKNNKTLILLILAVFICISAASSVNAADTNNSTTNITDNSITNITDNTTSTQSNYTGPKTNTTNWTKNIGTSYIGELSHAVADSDGNVYVGGDLGTDYYLYSYNSSGTLNWKYKTNTSVSGITIGSDGILYVTTHDGTIYAFYSNGTVKWSQTSLAVGSETGMIFGYGSAPVLTADGTILYLASENSAALYAVNATDGTIIWSCGCGAAMSSPVVGSDGTIYVTNRGGYLIAISSNGTLKWSYSTGAYNSIYSSAVIGPDGTIYAGTWGGILYAFNPNGTLKWTYAAIPGEYESDGSISGNIAVGSDGTIYYGTSGYTTTTMKIFALNPDGTVKWTRTLNEDYWTHIYSVAVGADGIIYAASFDSYQDYIYALDSNGTILWKYYLGSYINGNWITIGNGTLYLSSANGLLYVLKDPVPVANFTTNATTGTGSLTVQFTDKSSNATSWLWNFGDGSTSTEQNPTHTYSTPGTYTVTLTATGYGGTNTITESSLVTVYAVPSAGFTSNITNSTVQFTDKSSNVTGWSWDFGDGTTSTDENPVHTYSAPGTYKVVLTATGLGGSSTVTSYVTILDTTAPTANASLSNGTYNTTKTVTLAMSENGTIYYTTNGSTPTTGSKVYTGAITIGSTTTLKFLAVDKAGNKSPVYTVKYVIDKTAPTVGVSLKSGTYNTNKSVKLTMSEAGTIYYVKNGAIVSMSSTKYTSPISVTSSTTLKYFAVDGAGNKSPVYTVKYTIDKTAPKVSATNVKNGATGVSRTKTVSIKLSETVLKSVNWSKVYVKNLKTGKTCKATVWISGNHLYIKTSSKMSALTWYQVYIPASAVKDSAGNNLAAGCSFKFKTGKS
jgi:FOG: PKD repeat